MIERFKELQEKKVDGKLTDTEKNEWAQLYVLLALKDQADGRLKKCLTATSKSDIIIM